MNIYEYIDNYGIYTFNEKEINMVDKVIFSCLSYIDYRGIVNHEKITIKEAGRMHLGLHKLDEVNIIAVREANKILRYIKDTKRYKDCLLFNYVYEGTKHLQFGAVSIEYQKNRVYVSFEGTDQLISGWKEDLVLAYRTNTLSHKKAIKYLNKYYTFSNKHLIIGGHSKGGNLALVASIHANILVRTQIREVLNVDGPGLLDIEFYSKEFKKVLPKYKHIIPDNSLIGMCLNNTNETVVKATTNAPLSHLISYWEITDNNFILNELSPYSSELRIDLLNWVSKTHKNDIRKLTKNFQNIFESAGINSLIDIKKKKRVIFELIEESKNMDPEAKRVLIDLIKIVIKSIGDTYISEIKTKIKDYVD